MTVSLDEMLIILALEDKSVMHVFSIETSAGTSDLPFYTQEVLLRNTISINSSKLYRIGFGACGFDL